MGGSGLGALLSRLAHARVASKAQVRGIDFCFVSFVIFPPRVTGVVQCRTPSGSGVTRRAMIGLDG